MNFFRLLACSLPIWIVAVGPLTAEPLEGWGIDIKAAFKQAKKEDKPVLVEFTGSEWCPPCIAMRNNVFSKKEFVEAASKQFVLLELDFGKGHKAPKKNDKFRRKHKVNGYPTIVLFTAEGEEFSRFIASRYPTIDKFLAHLDGELGKMGD